jgi:hypothetical protein
MNPERSFAGTSSRVPVQRPMRSGHSLHGSVVLDENGGDTRPTTCVTTISEVLGSLYTPISPNFPAGRLATWLRLPEITLLFPDLISILWGVRSAHAHSPGPGLATSAALLAHVNDVRPELVFRGP